ncbi:MAG TPA: hypothetical protein VFN48_04505 [Solirubrobacteraceae bacterium]|nr:hypothetical protein [Solirubrobacteraceae bacterium]
MTTKDIRPTDAYIPCDICGRTLLRGERAEVFLVGGARHQVCELCKPRALQEGWIREGSVPDYDLSALAQERRRSVFSRRRRNRTPSAPAASPGPAATLDDALSGDAWPADHGGLASAPGPRTPRRRRGERSSASAERAPVRDRPARERPPRERPAERYNAATPGPSAPREPRQVHAVPTGDDSKISAAVDAFNLSEHPRTVAGVSRSLGAPTVAVIPDRAHPSLVRVVASWELCWYRYEVDLGSSRPSVRLDAQGYELTELDGDERVPAALADEGGRLHVGTL